MTDSAFSGNHQRDVSAVPGGPVYEDADVLIKHLPIDETGSAYLGYLILETRRNAGDLGDLTDNEAQKVGLWMSRVSRNLRAVLGADHVYAFVLGDHVPQFHVHIIARHSGTPVEFYGTRITDWPDAPRGNETAISDLVAKLRQRLTGAITHEMP